MTGTSAARPAAADEVMTIVAARRLREAKVCFIGVGRPSTAAILASRLHNRRLVLVYESGTIGAKPERIPLSIGDGELADTADAVVSVPEMFNYWVQPGRIDVAFLAAAQIDRFANLNTTVIGQYGGPRVRLPGAGGAPEIASACGEVVVIASHSRRTFVERVDFVTTVGHSDPGSRTALGFRGAGPTTVITDLGVLEPSDETGELTLTKVHPGIESEYVRSATGWPLAISAELGTTEPPTGEELSALRELIDARVHPVEDVVKAVG